MELGPIEDSENTRRNRCLLGGRILSTFTKILCICTYVSVCIHAYEHARELVDVRVRMRLRVHVRVSVRMSVFVCV